MSDLPQPPADLSLEELEQFHRTIAKQIEQRQEERRKQALDQINALIRENKLDPREVADSIVSRVKRRKAPAMYRNPDNARQTWSGKGTPPQWFIDAPDKEALKIANERKKN